MHGDLDPERRDGCGAGHGSVSETAPLLELARHPGQQLSFRVDHVGGDDLVGEQAHARHPHAGPGVVRRDEVGDRVVTDPERQPGAGVIGPAAGDDAVALADAHRGREDPTHERLEVGLALGVEAEAPQVRGHRTSIGRLHGPRPAIRQTGQER
jgi:hypothetical protein